MSSLQAALQRSLETPTDLLASDENAGMTCSLSTLRQQVAQFLQQSKANSLLSYTGAHVWGTLGHVITSLAGAQAGAAHHQAPNSPSLPTSSHAHVSGIVKAGIDGCCQK